MLLASLLALVAPLQSYSLWSAADRVSIVSKRAVVVEWFESSNMTLPLIKESETADKWLSRLGQTSGRNVKIAPAYVGLQLRWIPPRLRLFDAYREWSSLQRNPQQGTVRFQKGLWTIALRPGETLTLRHLASRGLKIEGAPESFLDVRLIVKCARTESKVLLDAIMSVLGGRLADDAEPWKVRLDPASFRERRLTLARESRKRERAGSLQYAEDSIELEMLPMLKDADLGALYQYIDGPDAVLPAPSGSALALAVGRKLELAQRAAGDVAVPLMERSPLDARASSNGTFGGRVMAADGKYLHF